jgi:hypothetical protein
MSQSSTKATVHFLDGSSATYNCRERKVLCAGRVVEITDAEGDAHWINIEAVQAVSFVKAFDPDEYLRDMYARPHECA